MSNRFNPDGIPEKVRFEDGEIATHWILNSTTTGAHLIF
jgi:hypothetical protein